MSSDCTIHNYIVCSFLPFTLDLSLPVLFIGVYVCVSTTLEHLISFIVKIILREVSYRWYSTSREFISLKTIMLSIITHACAHILMHNTHTHTRVHDTCMNTHTHICMHTHTCAQRMHTRAHTDTHTHAQHTRPSF